MPILNRSIARKYQSLFIPAKEFNSIGMYDGDATGDPVGIQDVNTVGVVLAEVGTTGFLGLGMNTDGVTCQTFLPLPRDVDTGQPIYVRIHWTTQSATAADTVAWKVFYEKLVLNTTLLSGTIDNVLDTVIASDNVIAADTWHTTAAGIINASSIDATTVGALTLKVEMDAKAVGLSEELSFLGLELAYAPLYATDTGAGVSAAAPW